MVELRVQCPSADAMLPAAPEPALRRLFDTMALTIHYDTRDHVATCSTVVEEHVLAAIGERHRVVWTELFQGRED